MLEKDIKMGNITNSEIEHVAKAAAVRLQTNNLKMQGLSNSQAKTAAASAMATQEMIGTSKCCDKSGLNFVSIHLLVVKNGVAMSDVFQHATEHLNRFVLALYIHQEECDACIRAILFPFAHPKFF